MTYTIAGWRELRRQTVDLLMALYGHQNTPPAVRPLLRDVYGGLESESVTTEQMMAVGAYLNPQSPPQTFSQFFDAAIDAIPPGAYIPSHAETWLQIVESPGLTQIPGIQPITFSGKIGNAQVTAALQPSRNLIVPPSLFWLDYPGQSISEGEEHDSRRRHGGQNLDEAPLVWDWLVTARLEALLEIGALTWPTGSDPLSLDSLKFHPLTTAV